MTAVALFAPGTAVRPARGALPETTPTTWVVAPAAVADGELDIGRLAESYVPADVLARALRADGRPVLFTGSVLGHHPDVAARALRTGRSPSAVAEAFAEAAVADWQHAGIAFDAVACPRTDPGHRRRLAARFRRLHADGVLVARQRELPYCPACEHWLDGRLLTGRCPHGTAAATGGPCPRCPGTDGLRCAICGATPALRQAVRLELPLEPFRAPLLGHWSTACLPPAVRAVTDRLTEGPLPAVPATAPGEWGLPVPLDGYHGQRVAWDLEAALSHLIAAETVAEGGPYRAVHFLPARDTVLHAVLLPALLHTAQLPPPHELFVGEPYRATAPDAPLWALDALVDLGADVVRHHALAHREPHGDLPQAHRHLTETWSGRLRALFTRIRTEHDGLVPDAPPGGTDWPALRSHLRRAAADLAEAYHPRTFAPHRALAVLDQVASAAAEFSEANAAETDPAPRARALVAELAVANALAAWSWPVMPHGAARLAAALGTSVPRPITAAALCPPPPGTRIEPPSGPVFGQ